MMKFVYGTMLLSLTVALAACGKDATSPSRSSADVPTAPASGTEYLLASEPEGAKEVIEARKDAEDDKPIVVVGRIGGGQNPWIEGRAAFSIVDNSLKACSDIPGDACPTPWDYCCQTDKLPAATALVKVVDESGELIKADARKLLNLKELETVVVHGKAQRDEAGNLTVLADGIYVRK